MTSHNIILRSFLIALIRCTASDLRRRTDMQVRVVVPALSVYLFSLDRYGTGWHGQTCLPVGRNDRARPKLHRQTSCVRPNLLRSSWHEMGGSVKRSLAMAQIDWEKGHRQCLRP